MTTFDIRNDDLSMKKRFLQEKQRTYKTSFLAGASAGLVVDVALFPLDTLKTRLQSQYGFWNSGGFKGIYKGVGPTAIGSAPCAATFFLSYNAFKYTCQPMLAPHNAFMVHMAAAAIAETISCTIRVPTEIIKQRRQACVGAGTSLGILTTVLKAEGVRGLYHGFWTTVLRDAPYSIIQFPLWEYFKMEFRKKKNGDEPSPAEGALCGALAGAIAGAVTTPLDVVKTRIMLAGDHSEGKTHVSSIVSGIFKEKGLSGFFAGFLPRVAWIFLGGGIFFGVYEHSCVILEGE